MTTTIFIPISRDEHLPRLFAALELLSCDRKRTNLFTYVDGDVALYTRVRNLTEGSKFEQRLCVHRKQDKYFKEYDVKRRRIRIAAIHNDSRSFIQDCDYVLGLEDDTIIPTSALEQLQRAYAAHPYAGFIEGVELGRWGIPYVGAWVADDVYEPTKLETLELGKGVQEIDAGGWYCYLTKRANYMREARNFGNNDLGPDVEFGLALRQEGFKNYIDWSVLCEHRTRDGASLTLANTVPQSVIMVKESNEWRRQVS